MDGGWDIRGGLRHVKQTSKKAEVQQSKGSWFKYLGL